MGAPPKPASCASGATRGAARESVRRLTREELRAALTDLLPIGSQLNADLDAFPDVGHNDDFGRFSPHHTDTQVAQWLSVVDKASGLVAGDAKLRASLSADPCLAAATVSATCWQTVLRGFLRRAFRRPVSDEEVGVYAAPVAGKDPAAGVQAVLLRILLAPDFLFHIETGTAPEGVRVRLTDHEVASRISFALTGGVPDAALATAADGGQLKTLAQVEAHVRRLMETPRASQQVQRFFGAWMDTGGIPNPDPQVYTGWAKLPGEPGVAERDLEKDVTDFVDAVVLKEKGTFVDLMTKRSSYTKSAMLQAIYGASATATQGVAYATPDHPGLPMRAGFLVDPGLNTRPIVRGVRYLKRIMCEDLPSPDPAIIAMRDDVKVDPLTMPNHQRVAAITGAPACQACHTKINPLGFVLEGFDQVGRKRAQESYLESVKGAIKVSATHPLPGPVEHKFAGLPPKLASSSELADGIGASQVARACMATYLVRQLQRRKETALDECALGEATGVLAQGPVLEAFVKSVANEDVFWRGL
jgi:hypothetical protein